MSFLKQRSVIPNTSLTDSYRRASGTVPDHLLCTSQEAHDLISPLETRAIRMTSARIPEKQWTAVSHLENAEMLRM